jgi:hypothetical protein
LVVQVTPAQHQAVADISNSLGMNMSQFIRGLVDTAREVPNDQRDRLRCS